MIHLAEQHLNIGAREEQQDSAWHEVSPDRKRGLFVVSDGVGGQSGGKMASEAVIRVARSIWKEVGETHCANPGKALRKLAQDAHDEINRISSQNKTRGRATLVAAFVQGNKAWWVHSGDSRLLRFVDGAFSSRTRDHSVVQVLLERGKIQEHEMGTHPDQGRLLQSLGGDDFDEPDCEVQDLKSRETLILCTDGFWERVTSEELAELVAQTEKIPLRNRMVSLTGTVVERGEGKADNAALIVVSTRPQADVNRWFFFTACAIFLVSLLVVLPWDKFTAKDELEPVSGEQPGQKLTAPQSPEEVTPSEAPPQQTTAPVVEPEPDAEPEAESEAAPVAKQGADENGHQETGDAIRKLDEGAPAEEEEEGPLPEESGTVRKQPSEQEESEDESRPENQ